MDKETKEITIFFNKTQHEPRKKMSKISETIMPSGYTFQQVMLLNALRRQAKSGMLMTNPRVTGYTSFAKAVLAFINDPKAPKTCKKLYEYLVKNGYYEELDVHLA